jgi:hypothetical protein
MAAGHVTCVTDPRRVFITGLLSTANFASSSELTKLLESFSTSLGVIGAQLTSELFDLASKLSRQDCQ